MAMQECRSRFEDRVCLEFGPDGAKRCQNGEYFHPGIQQRWLGWLAAVEDASEDSVTLIPSPPQVTVRIGILVNEKGEYAASGDSRLGETDLRDCLEANDLLQDWKFCRFVWMEGKVDLPTVETVAGEVSV